MTGLNDDDSSERAFALLMLVLSVIIFVAILKGERSESNGSDGRPDAPAGDRSREQ
jgi:uncharacterized membrane protein